MAFIKTIPYSTIASAVDLLDRQSIIAPEDIRSLLPAWKKFLTRMKCTIASGYGEFSCRVEVALLIGKVFSAELRFNSRNECVVIAKVNRSVLYLDHFNKSFSTLNHMEEHLSSWRSLLGSMEIFFNLASLETILFFKIWTLLTITELYLASTPASGRIESNTTIGRKLFELKEVENYLVVALTFPREVAAIVTGYLFSFDAPPSRRELFSLIGHITFLPF